MKHITIIWAFDVKKYGNETKNLVYIYFSTIFFFQYFQNLKIKMPQNAIYYKKRKIKIK